MIELRDISKIYHSKKGHVHALTNINLTVQRGEIFGVIGRSGAGKSTLIRCVNLLEAPTTGQVVVDQQELTTLSAKQLRHARHNIGMIFQHFNLLATRSAYENVAFPLYLQGKTRHEISEQVWPLLQLTGIEDKAHAYPSQLSGGQKQRVAIARALVTQPHVLLCDEMTSALDPETTDAILDLIQKINQEMHLTMLFITHEMDVIKKIADRVAVIDEGKIIEQDTVLEVFKNPKTAIARRFTQTSMHVVVPPVLRDKLRSAPLDDGYTLIRIAFVGDAAAEPVIDDLIKHFNLQLNILQAKLDYLHTETIGMMLVAAKAKKHELQQALQYLETKNVNVEVMGYVTTDDWRIS